MIRNLRFSQWAQPVTSRPWAIVCVALNALKQASGDRLFVRATHRAWERACGL